MAHDFLMLAAADNRLNSLLRSLRQASLSRENAIFLLFAVVIAAIWLALFFWSRLSKATATLTQSADSLFDQLCQAHGLEPADRAGLIAAAQECRLASPSLLFVRPEHLLQLAGDGMPKANFYRQLRQRLFGTL